MEPVVQDVHNVHDHDYDDDAARSLVISTALHEDGSGSIRNEALAVRALDLFMLMTAWMNASTVRL